MTVKSTDPQDAFQYYINYTDSKLYKITYDGSAAAGTPTKIENSTKVDFNYNINDINPEILNVDSINAKSITTHNLETITLETDTLDTKKLNTNTLDTDTLDAKEIIMPVNNNSNNTVTITAIADEVAEDGSPLPALNLDL